MPDRPAPPFAHEAAVTCVIAVLFGGACATTGPAVALTPGRIHSVTDCPVFVAATQSRFDAFQGNVSRNAEAALRLVAERTLGVALERCSDAELVPLLQSEQQAAALALQRHARFLLMPTIVQWKEMRTDDPIGAFILPHNRVAIEVRLMDLIASREAGRAMFSNRSHITLNQPAERLLNDGYRALLRELLERHAVALH